MKILVVSSLLVVTYGRSLIDQLDIEFQKKGNILNLYIAQMILNAATTHSKKMLI